MSITRLPGGVEAAGVVLPQWTIHVSWTAFDPGFQPCFIASSPCVVTSVVGRIEYPEGTLSEMQVVRARNGQPADEGTLVVVDALDANGTPAENQSLVLASLADRTLDAGDCLITITAGDWNTSIGCMQVTLQARGIDA